MAALLSRPDPSSPASVAEAGFSTARRGYSQDEVRAFLTSVAAELSRLKERERQLEAAVEQARDEVPTRTELDEDEIMAFVGEETLRVLQTARESASQIKIRAEEAAATILREANAEATRLRQDADVEAARKRHDATTDAETEVALAKQQGREMVNEARSYRERVLADLERRTKLARQQIEDLAHGRDRLLQVFERARLVAVDVTTELQDIDGPTEDVNLSPTTGPIPVMVPVAASDRSRVTMVDDEPVSESGSEAGGNAAPDDESTGADPVGSDASDEQDVDEIAEIDTGADEHTWADDVGADEAVAVDDLESPDADDESAPKPRDANVVSLFRGRDADVADADDDVDVSGEPGIGADDETVADEKPDVDGIFERLRSDAPDATDVEPGDDEPVTAAISAPDAVADVERSTEPTAFSRRDEAIVPLIVGGARKLKRVLADEQNGVLEQLRQRDANSSLDDLISDVEAHLSTYVDAIADDLLEAAVAGAVELGASDTKKLRSSLTKADAVGTARGLLRDDLVVPLRERLGRAIGDGSDDHDDVAKRVRGVYREYKTRHIDDQLDDVFRFAHGGGVAATATAGTELIWNVDPSEPTCPDCEDNSLSGPVVVGEPYATGHVAAPAHPGCRCLTLPARQ